MNSHPSNLEFFLFSIWYHSAHMTRDDLTRWVSRHEGSHFHPLLCPHTCPLFISRLHRGARKLLYKYIYLFIQRNAKLGHGDIWQSVDACEDTNEWKKDFVCRDVRIKGGLAFLSQYHDRRSAILDTEHAPAAIIRQRGSARPHAIVSTYVHIWIFDINTSNP